jgi:hypothetical protein
VRRSEYPFLDRQSPLVQRFRCAGVAAFGLDAGQSVEDDGDLVVFGTEHPGVDAQRLPVGVLGLFEVMRAEQDRGEDGEVGGDVRVVGADEPGA